MSTEQEMTAEQKAQIEAKREELRRVHESLEDMSPDKRQAAMQAKHDELKAWAEQNNIPLELLPSPRRGQPQAG